MKQDADGIWLCWFHRWGTWDERMILLVEKKEEPVERTIQERRCTRCGIRQYKILEAR